MIFGRTLDAQTLLAGIGAMNEGGAEMLSVSEEASEGGREGGREGGSRKRLSEGRGGGKRRGSRGR